MKREKKPSNFHKKPVGEKIVLDTGPGGKVKIKNAAPTARTGIQTSSTTPPKK